MIQQFLFWAYPKRIEMRIPVRCLYTILMKALFTRAKGVKQLKCPSTDKSINKMWYLQTIKYYSAIKRKYDTWNTMGEF